MMDTPHWLQREEALLGATAVDCLQNSRVAVIGIGGVGSFVAEGLARAGVGSLILMDGDVVSETNLNRQLVALHSTVGKPKAEVMRDRILDISPSCNCTAKVVFYGDDTDPSFLDDCDFVVDAVDMVSAKIALAVYCSSKNISLISAMGCGNKLDPTGFRIADLAKTSVCPLCRVMRRELRVRGIEHLPVLYSEETPIHPEGERVPGSVSYVPSVAGLMMAGYVIRELTKEN